MRDILVFEKIAGYFIFIQKGNENNLYATVCEAKESVQASQDLKKYGDTKVLLTVLFTPDRMRYIALLMSSQTTGIDAMSGLDAMSWVDNGLVQSISDSFLPLLTV